MKINREGQNNEVIIANDELIFRFPKYYENIRNTLNTVKVLKLLNDYISIPIPSPIHVENLNEEVGEFFWSYKKLKGNPINKINKKLIYDELDIGYQMGMFLSELHNMKNTKIDKFLIKSEDENWKDFYSRVENKLFKYMNKNKIKEVERNFHNFFIEKNHYKNTIIHGDFGLSNIIYDKELGKVNGIIDFDSIHIGDPAIDVAALFSRSEFDSKLYDGVKKAYPEIENCVERAKFYKSTFALQEALFGIENGDEQAFKDGISKYI